MIRELLAVGGGGALGSICRYALSYGLLAGQTICGFPAGTFTVNAVGSLLRMLRSGAALCRIERRGLHRLCGAGLVDRNTTEKLTD